MRTAMQTSDALWTVRRLRLLPHLQDMLDRIRAQEARAHSHADASGSGSGAKAWPKVEYVHMEGELLPVEPESFDGKR